MLKKTRLKELQKQKDTNFLQRDIWRSEIKKFLNFNV